MKVWRSFYKVGHAKDDVAAVGDGDCDNFELEHEAFTKQSISSADHISFRCGFMIPLRWEEALEVEKASRTLRDRIIIRLCLFAGLRAHEVADSRIEHVDPLNGWIYVPHGHRSGPRVAAVDKRTLTLIAKYVGDRRVGPLFCSKLGPGITRYTVYHTVSRTGQRAHVVTPKQVSPLMLRHCFATTWLKRKGNIHWLQKQLGHVALQSTAYYLDWLPYDVKAEHARLFETLEPVEKWRERVRAQFGV